MKKIIFLGFFVICITAHIQAQKEKNLWHFGQYAGLNFTNASTKTLTDFFTGESLLLDNMPEAIESPINTSEGCFTLSDADGNLLMSSDGVVVYNKNGELMENGTGLLGGSSATQSGIVVPHPTEAGKYYIVTVPQDRIANGIRYSIVDLNENGGLGKVIQKNVLLLAGSVDENIGITPKSDESGYWLVHRTGLTFYVWELSGQGFSAPITYSLPAGSLTTSNYGGSLFFSSDGKIVVSCSGAGPGHVTVAYFDPSTGVIDVANSVSKAFAYFPYSGTFTANNSHLYISCVYSGIYLSGILYKVNVADLMNRTAYYESIGSYSNGRDIVNLKLSPVDDRLYGISKGSRDLYMIENPEGAQIIRKFSNYLKEGTLSWLGLPTFASSVFYANSKAKSFYCTSYQGVYTIDIDNAVGVDKPVKLVWNFGDKENNPTTVTQDIIVGTNKYSQKFIYPNKGEYTITVTPYRLDGTAIKAIVIKTSIVNCTLKSNRMTRTELLNTNQLARD